VQPNILRDLGDGLILRAGAPEDTEPLAEFNAFIFRNRETNEQQETLRWWTRDLCNGHPSVKPSDFTVVEDTRTSKIVSSFVWISQRWGYGDIEFGVGRPEMVGTHPDYRARGLVRAQFEVAHEWSAQRGELMQVITGIPYFYRQFGYEMTVQLGAGRAGYRPHVPMLKKDEPEPYRIRAMTEADIPLVMELEAVRQKRSLLNAVRDEKSWRYEISGKSEKNMTRAELRVIQTQEGEPVGILGHAIQQWGQTIAGLLYELKPGVSWLAVSPSVIRYLWATGEGYNLRDKKDGVSEFVFELGQKHPFYDAMRDHLPKVNKGYAWYIRVPDMVAFLRTIAPVLEQRLANSVAVGYTGELKLSFYRSGVRLALDKGRITTVEAWKPGAEDSGVAGAFPGLTFQHLLFGYKSLDELRAEFPDCWAGGNTNRAILDALFPKQDSDVWPIA
jgi:hypothetical protein